MARDGRSGLRGELWLPVIGRLCHARRPDRQDAEGRAARRDAGPAADPVRAGDQSESGARYRDRDPAIDPRPRRRGHRMNRRELLLLLGGAMTAATTMARAVRAQQKAMPVIGFLGGEAPDALAANLTAFRQGLIETGYIEGKNLAIEYRWAEGRYDRLPGLAAELVRRRPAVIVTYGASAIGAVKSATSTISIVFFGGGDPVASGLVASLARPGGNLTGVSIMAPELNPKRLDLVYELVPQAGVIALLVNPN